MGKKPSGAASTGREQHPAAESRSSQIELAIEQQIGDLVPQKSKDQVVARITAYMASEHFSGPLPHPRHLAEYESIAEGSANRIFEMAERQQNHQIMMENKVVDAEVNDQKRGMYMGFGSFIFLIACAAIAGIAYNQPVVAGLFLTAAAIGGVGLFIRGRSNGNAG